MISEKKNDSLIHLFSLDLRVAALYQVEWLAEQGFIEFSSDTEVSDIM